MSSADEQELAAREVAEDEVSKAGSNEDEDKNEDEDEDGDEDCDWSDAEDDDKDFERDEKKRVKVGLTPIVATVEFWKDGAKAQDEAADKVASELLASAESLERLWLTGSHREGLNIRKLFHPQPRHHRILDAAAAAIVKNLRILRVDNFPGASDPIFGTRRESARRTYAADYDLFTRLAAAFKDGGRCHLQKLTLQGGCHSSKSFIAFIKSAKPPLESFRCRETFFHGRNFEPIIKGMKAGLPHPEKLLEFETDAYIAGQDPLGLIADAFPNLKMLRVARVYSKEPLAKALANLKNLNKRLSKFSKPNRALRGNCVVSEPGMVSMFVSSDHHDDGYRGQGLWWDEISNSCECMEDWLVGRGVTKDMVLKFFAECGIELDEGLDEDDCGGSDGELTEEEDEAADVVIQVSAGAPDATGQVELTGNSLAGEPVVKMRLDPASTELRDLLDELASKLGCGMLSVKAVFPNGTAAQMTTHGDETLRTLLA